MNKQDFIQTCVLKVNSHCQCEGCSNKLRKLLQKVDGQKNTVDIDPEQGKVIVRGNVHPEKLIKKLNKSGKHAELWEAQKTSNNYKNNLNTQFKSIQIGNGKNNKSQNGKKGGGGQHALRQMKEAKVLFVAPKEKKSVSFNLSEDHIDRSDDDEFDDGFDDEFDDGYESGHGHGHHLPPNKMIPMMGKAHGTKGMVNVDAVKKKSEVFYTPFVSKGKGGNDNQGKSHSGGKKGSGNGGKKKGGDQNHGGKKYKYGSRSGGGLSSLCKMFCYGKNVRKEGNDTEKGYDFGSGKKYSKDGAKKVGGKADVFSEFDQLENEFHEIDIKSKGRGSKRGVGLGMDGGRGGGSQVQVQGQGGHGGSRNMEHIVQHGDRNMDQMGQISQMGQKGHGGAQMGAMSNYPKGEMGPPAQGLGASSMMNGGYYQGMGAGDPYNQQHMDMMMMMNQQRADRNDRMFQPMMMYPQPHTTIPSYSTPSIPPPAASNDPYTNFFNDENTESCNIM